MWGNFFFNIKWIGIGILYWVVYGGKNMNGYEDVKLLIKILMGMVLCIKSFL